MSSGGGGGSQEGTWETRVSGEVSHPEPEGPADLECGCSMSCLRLHLSSLRQKAKCPRRGLEWKDLEGWDLESLGGAGCWQSDGARVSGH